MEIKLKAENDVGKTEIILSDDEFSVNGFISIQIGNEIAEIHINDILPAIVSFDTKFKRENS